MKDITNWWLRDLVVKRVYAALVVVGILVVAIISTYALIPSEVVQVPEIQTIKPVQPPPQPEDNPLYSLNEVKATIATSLYSKLPEVHKTFSRSGPLQGEKSIREYNDFHSIFVDVSYSGNGEWVFIASTPAAEFSRDYIGMKPSGVWQYREIETYFKLRVTGIYYERIHKFDIHLVERVDEEEQATIREF